MFFSVGSQMGLKVAKDEGKEKQEWENLSFQKVVTSWKYAKSECGMENPAKWLEKQLILYACLKSNCGGYTGLRSEWIVGTYWKENHQVGKDVLILVLETWSLYEVPIQKMVILWSSECGFTHFLVVWLRTNCHGYYSSKWRHQLSVSDCLMQRCQSLWRKSSGWVFLAS